MGLTATAVIRPPEVPDRCPFTIGSSPISPSRCAAEMGCVAMSCAWWSSAAYTIEKKQGRPLTDDEYLAVLTREVKTRRESVEAFTAGHRDDLVAKEEAEIAIIGDYLPGRPDRGPDRRPRPRGDRRDRCDSARDMGKVMGWLSPRTRGRADGKHVSELVVQALAATDLAAHDVGTH